MKMERDAIWGKRWHWGGPTYEGEERTLAEGTVMEEREGDSV